MKLSKDAEVFKRLRCKYPEFDYLSIVEPQGCGAWHCHILLKFNQVNEIWIKPSEIEKMWGKGFEKVKAIKSNVDNLGNYLSAYLGDIEYNLENLKLLKKNGKSINDFKINEVEIEGSKKNLLKAQDFIYILQA